MHGIKFGFIDKLNVLTNVYILFLMQILMSVP